MVFTVLAVVVYLLRQNKKRPVCKNRPFYSDISIVLECVLHVQGDPGFVLRVD
jgi:hypothetical protein